MLLHPALNDVSLRTIVLPRQELAPFVRNIMLGGFPSVEVHLPARTDPQLVVYLRGGSVVLREDGREERLPQAFVTGPVLEPGRFRTEPGACFISATFRPSGFLHCFGIPVNLLGRDPVPLDSLLAPDELLPLLDRLHRARRSRDLVAALESFLLRARARADRDPPFLPVLGAERLLRPAAELAASLEVSTRQFERRFLMHHGLPLRDVRRLARLSMALALLMRSQPGAASLAAAAHDAGYVDQPHFNRDFRQFVGDTPASFLRRRFDSGAGYGFWQMDSEELRAFTG
ncbi:AraC family transcriptional regulator [Massilia sp. ST3]|uniref:helix-turn-helix domain-containing protein n=1 Tax=Massilia sp. ST3 TaxID=2824903 RepID=UPI001B844532|nr:helix-turn-helix domain-containing protein [Massilia sp. ST3]MBQ5946442.1 AraC family transcriptional regulator [Massilia sp. ST3]